jgi:hypothetical protein
MNFTPRQWLEMDMARSYGLDKASWAERLAWAHNHPTLQEGAKEPFLYKSAQEACDRASWGLPVDHLISLDATASGIQCLALMAQDSQSAFAVNLGTYDIRNPYKTVQDQMGSQYPYEKVKKALMTSFYESVATPLNLFGDDYDKFVNAAQQMLPGPWALKEAIASCMKFKDFYGWTMMDGFKVNMDVTTPINCSMDIGGMNMEWIEHRKAEVATKGLTANVTHSLDALVLREVLRRTNCNHQWYLPSQLTPFEVLREKDIALMQSILRWQRSQFLSFEFLQYVDESNQHLVPLELQQEVYNRHTTSSMYIQPIHDCYRVRATDASDLFQIVREVMADLAYSKSAWWILTQLGYEGKINDDESKRSALKAQVLKSSYLIC